MPRFRFWLALGVVGLLTGSCETGGARDGGLPDSGLADAGGVDSGVPDAGDVDSGTVEPDGGVDCLACDPQRSDRCGLDGCRCGSEPQCAPATACVATACGGVRAWTLIPPSTMDRPTSLAALTWDAARRRLVLLEDTHQGHFATWEYEPVTRAWSLRTTAGPDTGSFVPLLAWDADRQVTVFYSLQTKHTWVWDGTGWSDVTPKPSYMNDAAFGPDSGVPPGERGWWNTARHRVEATGAHLVYPGAIQWSVLGWDGLVWEERLAAYQGSQPAMRRASVAWDPSRERLVLSGTRDNSTVTETWELSAAWQQIPVVSPGCCGAMAWDEPTGKTVLLQGATGWAWDGASWSSFPSPGDFARGEMVFDPSRSRLLLVTVRGALPDAGVLNGTAVWEY